MIPFRLGGESGPEDPTWQLLPVWTGTSFTREQSLEILGRPYPLFYDCFQPGNGVVQDSNALFSSEPRGSIYQFEVTATGESTDARLVYPDTSGETLAATILALVVSSQPTEDRPLNVTLITQNDSPPAWFESFKTCPEWETAHSQGSKVTLTCSFAWDPETAALSQGAVPSKSSAPRMEPSSSKFLRNRSNGNHRPKSLRPCRMSRLRMSDAWSAPGKSHAAGKPGIGPDIPPGFLQLFHCDNCPICLRIGCTLNTCNRHMGDH
jgi:hypothetical protein